MTDKNNISPLARLRAYIAFGSLFTLGALGGLSPATPQEKKQIAAYTENAKETLGSVWKKLSISPTHTQKR